MAGPLSERWTSWLEAHRAQSATSRRSENCQHLPERFVEKIVRKELSAEGFSVPVQRQLLTHLALGLEPLESSAGSISQRAECHITFGHLLNMVWQPLLQHIEALINGLPARWTGTLDKHQALLIHEMRGNVLKADEAMPVDDWLHYVQVTIDRLVGVTVPLESL